MLYYTNSSIGKIAKQNKGAEKTPQPELLNIHFADRYNIGSYCGPSDIFCLL